MIIRVDGVLTQDECERLIRVFELNKDKASGKDFTGWPLMRYRDCLFGDDLPIVHKALDGAIKALQVRLGVTGQFPEQIILTGTGLGSYHVAHADNCRPDGKGGWEPNHTPLRTYTCMQYLNDEFEGGELRFPDRGFAIKPKPGMLVAFPSDRHHVHEVTPVTSGARYSLAVWLTDNQKVALHML